jgi:hypothetical protein
MELATEASMDSDTLSNSLQRLKTHVDALVSELENRVSVSPG